ncbi:MAG: SGNH/GDSL hydrolase family protein, partial [Bacillota bacterium]|nr:SGNH/GDSL hydrolase family protein [Bacillota bacterium]
VLDYEANAGLNGIRQTLPTFLDILRQAHPAVPIVVLSKPRYAQERFDSELRKERLSGASYQRQLIKDRRSQGDHNLHFINGGRMLGRDFDLCSVDGVHPTDLGFWRMARYLTPVIRQFLV